LETLELPTDDDDVSQC